MAEGRFGYFPAVRGNTLVSAPIEEAISCLKTVPLDSPLLDIARSMGTYLGE